MYKDKKREPLTALNCKSLLAHFKQKSTNHAQYVHPRELLKRQISALSYLLIKKPLISFDLMKLTRFSDQ